MPYETWGGWWQAHIRLVPILLTPEVIAEADTLLRRAEETAGAEGIAHDRVQVI